MYVYLFVFPHPRGKNSLYVRNIGHIEPLLNFWAGKLQYVPVGTGLFQRHQITQIAEKQHNWPPRLLSIMNSFKLKHTCTGVHTQMKIKSRFEALPGEFA